MINIFKKTQNKFIDNISNSINISLQKKLKIFSMVILIPLGILIVFLFINMQKFGERYNKVVQNIALANKYNLSFKESIDYTIYKAIIGSLNLSDIHETENIKNPYILIEATREDFNYLASQTSIKSYEKVINTHIKGMNSLFDTLISKIDIIKKNIESPSYPGRYKENMIRLDTDIRITTELIQEKIQIYISHEANILKIVSENIAIEIKNTLQMSIFAFAVIIILSWILTQIIAESISRPIQNLCETAKLVGKGDFTTRANDASGDEIVTLTKSFNNMIEKIASLIEDVKIEQLNLRATELKLLQSQINPHFLYNTLDTIIWLAEGNKKEEVVEMVSSLSEFFRTTLSKGQDFITLREEETHIRSYLQIQKVRYSDILEYEINIPEELKDYKILKLTLQPLVENALYHGIKNKRGKGKIIIDGKYENEKIIFDVFDDGIGIKKNNLDKIKKSLEDGIGLDGYGLLNVNQRIKLYYGKEYGIKIDSVYGEFTKVNIIIPVEFLDKLVIS